MRGTEPGEWLERHGERLKRYAFSWVRDWNEAEELVQQALVTAYGARDRYRGESSELTWLTGVLRNKVLEHFRGRARYVTMSPQAGEFLPHAITPEQEAESAEFQLIVRNGLQELSPRAARAFELIKIKGGNHRVVADVMGVAPGNLAVMIYRARVRLKRYLEDRYAPARLLSQVAALLLIGAGAASAATVSRIDIEGATTRPEVIRALIDTRVGRDFDRVAWERDLRRLRNLDYFYDVDGQVRETDGKVDITLRVRNKLSTLPVFKFKRGGGASLLTVGLYEVNFLDRLLEVGGQYERFNGKPGFVTWFRHPYLLSRRNRFGTEVFIHTLNLPLLTDKGVEEAFFDNKETRWNARLQRELHESLRAGLEAGFYRNDFLRDDGTPQKAARNDAFAHGTSLRSGRTVSLTPSVSAGRLDRDRHFVFGHEATAQVELAHRALGSQFGFAKGQLAATGGWLLPRSWNVVYQARLGSKTGRDFQHKFYLGGLDTTRGFLDRQFRGEHMWLANLEARPTLIDRPAWVLQGGLFTDFAKTWDARNFGVDGFGDPIFSYGVGARLILPKVYRAILRLDLARTQRPIQQFGVNFGLQQFF